MLTCKELTELITDYLEGHQSFLERMRFELHLGMCRHCRAYLRQMRTTIETLGKLPEESIPPEMGKQLLDRFRDWKR
ncbi:MAG: zf-HC2 domain-containing protein [Acidobacteria bacterium]|nr:zf-HC2 domain-containing protein [Acidobacteriota bacterium]